MKTIELSFILFLLSSMAMAQNWAPVGSKWYYDEHFAFSGNINYILYTAEKDTVFGGQACSKITKKDDIVCFGRPPYELMFSRNDSVFFYDPQLSIWQLLYNFNAVQNDSWSLLIHETSPTVTNDTLYIHVDSVTSMTVNAQVLKVLNVTYHVHYPAQLSQYKSRIVERFGDLWFMFNFAPFSSFACDGNYSGGIRCYDDPILGFYHFPDTDTCEYVYTGINQIEKDNIHIFPNPANESIHISGISFPVNYQITDMNGKLAREGTLTRDLLEIKNLAPGNYLFGILDVNGKQIITKKLIKE